MEYLDIVDENGEPTGEIIERSKAHYEGIWHRTSHVWIVRVRNGRLQILLQKRCADKDSFPGCYDISSAGHIPAGTGFVESAVRELKEELGVAAEADQLIFCGSRRISYDGEFHGKPYHDRQHSNIYAMWLDREETDFCVQPEEVESVLWISVDECFENIRQNSFRHCLEPEEIMTVCRKVMPEKYAAGKFLTGVK